MFPIVRTLVAISWRSWGCTGIGQMKDLHDVIAGQAVLAGGRVAGRRGERAGLTQQLESAASGA